MSDAARGRLASYLMIACLGLATASGPASPGCGGSLTSPQGVIHTPNFPHPFTVPIKCTWLIDSSAQPEDTSIVVYLTQVFVSTGLTFTEFDYYEPDTDFQYGGERIYEVTERDVISVKWVMTMRKFFVIDLQLDRLEGNHLRVLDDLLDVYGFNVTYEMVSGTDEPARNNSCSALDCSLAGNCYASKDFTYYWCSCFPGFSGVNCSMGPLCRPNTNICHNGATCRHVGMSALCTCTEGFTGPHCDIPIIHSGCDEGDECSTQCKFDGQKENVCNCNTNGVRVSEDRSRFEMKLRIANVSSLRVQHPGRTLYNHVQKQLEKVMKSASLSKVEDLRVLNISDGGEVVFHFFGSGYDGSRVKETANRLSAREKLGDIPLSHSQIGIHQDPPLHLESVRANVKELVVHEGDEFILSCIAQGSRYMTFSWYKDGAPINEKKSIRSMWMKLLPQDSRDQYTALLGVNDVSVLDEGRYTCQVTDWGIQECKSLYIQVLQPPQVHVSPLSATVEKGDNINLKCVSPNENGKEQFGYTWTRDNELFPMQPGKEVWEDLKPGGSILRVYNIQKSSTYTCQAHTSTATQEQSIRLDVVNKSSVAMCKSELRDDIKWGDTWPGSIALAECPQRYLGIARRQCLILEPGIATWQIPDFSNCIFTRVNKIITKFRLLSRGFDNSSVHETLKDLLVVLHERRGLYPGEGEPIVSLLNELIYYVNRTSAWDDLLLATTPFYAAVDFLLGIQHSVITSHMIAELQVAVNNWALLWGHHMNSTDGHLSYNAFVLNVIRFHEKSHSSYYFPLMTYSYPKWFNTKIAIHVVGENVTKYRSPNRLVVVNYKNISNFLSHRSSQKLIDGSEIMYEIHSTLVSVAAANVRKMHVELEFPFGHNRMGWNRTCAVSPSLKDDWDFHSCHISVKNSNFTSCVCHYPGIYAAFFTSYSAMDAGVGALTFNPSSIVLVGCVCCFAQSLLTFVLLFVRWWHHKTCVLFLKLQCCSSVAACMSMFLVVPRLSPSPNSYLLIASLLEALVFVAISAHLSKLLMVYAEIVHIPTVKHLKHTVFGIIFGITALAVLCSLLAQSLTGDLMSTWWLPYDSILFYVVVGYCVLILTLFIFLYYDLARRLNVLIHLQNEKKSQAVTRRIGLMKRSAVIISSTSIMTISSILFANGPSKINQYFFSVSCAFLGFIMFICYIVSSESTLDLHLLKKKLKLHESKDQVYYSESDSNLFNFYTKGAPEVESDSAPPCVKSAVSQGLSDVIPEKEKIPPKTKMVTFRGDVDNEVKAPGVDLEEYPSSPRKYRQDLVMPVNSRPPPNIIQELKTGAFLKALEIPAEPPIVKPQDMVTTRVCVELGVLKPPTLIPPVLDPSVLRCIDPGETSKGIELNELSVSPDATYINLKEQETMTDDQVAVTPEDKSLSNHSAGTSGESDVLDKISHDLDYLLNNKDDNGLRASPRHPKSPRRDLSDVSPTIARTSL